MKRRARDGGRGGPHAGLPPGDVHGVVAAATAEQGVPGERDRAVRPDDHALRPRVARHATLRSLALVDPGAVVEARDGDEVVPADAPSEREHEGAIAQRDAALDRAEGAGAGGHHGARLPRPARMEAGLDHGTRLVAPRDQDLVGVVGHGDDGVDPQARPRQPLGRSPRAPDEAPHVDGAAVAAAIGLRPHRGHRAVGADHERARGDVGVSRGDDHRLAPGPVGPEHRRPHLAARVGRVRIAAVDGGLLVPERHHRAIGGDDRLR